MLRVQEEKHLAFFDELNSYSASYQLALQRPPEKEEKDKSADMFFKEPSLPSYKI